MWCQENEIGMAQIGNTDAGVSMIILGNRQLAPNTVSIIAAHMLLTGVLTGDFHEDNKLRAQSDKGELPKDKIN